MVKDAAPLKNLVAFYGNQGPALQVRFENFCRRLQEARAARDELAVYRLHQCALPCGVLLLDTFQQLKRARQIIDFTDIEWMAYRLLANSDVHPYDKFRVNATLSNMPAFAEAWGCKTGTAMVRPASERCAIW